MKARGFVWFLGRPREARELFWALIALHRNPTDLTDFQFITKIKTVPLVGFKSDNKN